MTPTTSPTATEAGSRPGHELACELLDLSVEPLCSAAADGSIEWANDAWRRHVGGANGMPVERLILSRAHPRDRDDAEAALQSLAQGASRVRFHCRLTTADAGWLALDWTVARLAQGGLGFSTRNVSAERSALEQRDAARRHACEVASLSGVGSWEFDVETGSLHQSEQTKRIHELDPDADLDVDQAIGFYAPEAQPVIRAAVEHALATGESWDLELPFVTAKGRKIWVRALGRVQQERGRTVRLLGAFQDITAQREAQEQLRQAHDRAMAAENRLVCAIEAIDDAFVMYDADDRLLMCNRKFREFNSDSPELLRPGVSFETVLRSGISRGKFASAFGREEEWIAERLSHHRNPPPPFEQELDGDRFIRIEEKRTAAGDIVGFCVDITEAKRLQRELERSAEALRLSKELAEARRREVRALSQRLELAIDAAEIGVWSYDPVTDLVVADKQTCRLYGGHAQLASASESEWMDLIHPDDRERVASLWGRSKLEPIQEWIEFRVIARNGEIRHVRESWRRQACKDAGVRIVGVTLDITKDRRLAEELESAKDAALAKSQEIKQLSQRLSVAIRASDLGVWTYDFDRDRTEFDQRAIEIYGAEQDTTPTFGEWLDMVHPGDRERIRTQIYPHAGANPNLWIDFRVIRPDGSIRYLREAGLVQRSADGGCRLVGVTWDRTNDVAREKELHAAKEAADAKSREVQKLSQSLALSLEASGIGVWEFDPETGVIRVDASWPRRDAELRRGVSMTYEQWLSSVHPEDRNRIERTVADAVASNEPYRADFRVLGEDGAVTHLREQAEFYVDENGRRTMLGASWDVSEDVRRTEELRRAKDVAEAAHAELSRSAELVRHSALHDPLTGLPNRRYLDEVLQRRCAMAARHGGEVALLHIDLDRFKEINDSHGHAAGDEVLRHVGASIQSSLRKEDFAARIGGDEFIVVASVAEGACNGDLIAARIRKKLAPALEYEGRKLRVAASIGVVQRDGEEAVAETLMIDGDAALYRAKQNGRDRVELFTHALRTELELNRRTCDEIRHGLENDEFEPYYQPLFEAESLDIVGVEALVRWRHPERGVLAPGAFLDIAEKHDLVAHIDAQVMERAVEDATNWASLGFQARRMSVNVSAQRLEQDSLLTSLDGLDRHGSATVLAFELVESICLENASDKLQWNLDRLRERGVEIDLDDFGSGHASMVGLLTLQPDRLKIDRRLVMPIVEQVAQRRMIEAIVQIGESLDVKVVAEGVETFEHLRLLREIGCHSLQGYVLARPMPASAVLRFAQEEPWRHALLRQPA